MSVSETGIQQRYDSQEILVVPGIAPLVYSLIVVLAAMRKETLGQSRGMPVHESLAKAIADNIQPGKPKALLGVASPAFLQHIPQGLAHAHQFGVKEYRSQSQRLVQGIDSNILRDVPPLCIPCQCRQFLQDFLLRGFQLAYGGRVRLDNTALLPYQLVKKIYLTAHLMYIFKVFHPQVTTALVQKTSEIGFSKQIWSIYRDILLKFAPIGLSCQERY